jgi:lysophospholipase L1-like esterase
MSIKLSPARTGLRELIVETNDLIRDEIEQHPQTYYIDVFEAMLDDEGQPRRELYLEDGLHLSQAGYRLWAQTLNVDRNRIFTPLLPEIMADRLPSSVSEP